MTESTAATKRVKAQKPKTKREMKKPSVPHIEAKVELCSKLANDYADNSTGYVMSSLIQFYILQGERRSNKEQVELDAWLDKVINQAFADLQEVQVKVTNLAAELCGDNLPSLTYPRTRDLPIIISHPASFSVMEIFSQLDEVGKISDSLYMTRKLNRKQTEQIAQEARRAISKMVETINKFTNAARGRTKATPEDESATGTVDKKAVETKVIVETKEVGDAISDDAPADATTAEKVKTKKVAAKAKK